jgi:carbamoyl-phosphate synthase large subunit
MAWVISMIKVLITGAGGDVATGVIECLLKAEIKTKIFLAGNNRYACAMYSKFKSFTVPNVIEPTYVSKIIKILQDHEIDVLIPTIDQEIALIAFRKHEIEKISKCIVLVGNYEAVKVCSDKKLTIDFLKKNNFKFPYTQLYNEVGLTKFLKKNDYSFILKNRYGNGSKEVFLITKKSDLKNHRFNDDFIVQEYIKSSDGEYTTGIYTNLQGKTVAACTLRRTLENGATNFAERVHDAANEKMLNKIASKLHLPYLNIQSIKKNGEFIPFEFNGRFSGTTGVIRKVFNGPELQIKEFLLKEQLIATNVPDNFFAVKHSTYAYINENMLNDLDSRSKNYI